METSRPDEYERRYMDGDRALMRARHRLPRWFPFAMLAVLAAVTAHFVMVLSWLWENIRHPTALATFAVLAVYLGVTLVSGLLGAIVDHVTRVLLSETHLRVHRGLWADDIPLAAIERIDLVELSAWRPEVTVLGLLRRRERDYMAFGQREALRVDWRDANDRPKTTWIRFDQAGAFLARIASLRAGVTGVRALEESADETQEEAFIEASTALASRGQK